MSKNKHDSLERVKKLFTDIEEHLDEISYFHRLVELAQDCKKAKDVKLMLNAYLPIGKCRLEEINQILKLLKQALKDI